MKKFLLLAISAISLTGAAQAASLQCVPKDNTARILRQSERHGFRLERRNVGTGMSFIVMRTVNAETGKYLQGDLIATRCRTIGRNLFILAQEWDCGYY
jgi:hypothetical protein